MLENIVLGSLQGITEWLPISSEAVLVLGQTFFGTEKSLEEMIMFSLFLHMGTFLAALIYFRRDVIHISKNLLRYRKADAHTKRIITFLVLATSVSGAIGILLYQLVLEAAEEVALTGKGITLAIGMLLLITAWLQLKKRNEPTRTEESLNPCDGALLGIAQGLAVLPGISRSGITVAALLLRGLDDTTSLRLSFLLSLPIVLAGNIFLNIKMFAFDAAAFMGLFFSFVFGILTIHYLLRIASRINFGYFILIFGVVTIASVFI